MAEDRIDSVIDKPAIEAELKFLDTSLDTLLAKIQEFGKVKFNFSGAQDVGGLNDAQRKLTKGQTELSLAVKEYGKLVDAMAVKQAKINAGTSEQATEMEKLKQKEQELNQTRKDSVKLAEAQEGSINQLRIQLKLAQKDFDALSAAERNSAQGQGQLKKIQTLDAELKQLEGTTGRFQRNVGNYQGSAAIIVAALERTRQKFQELNRDSSSSPADIGRVTREMEALQRVVDQPQFLNVAAKFGDANAEAKFFTKTLISLEQQGLGNSQSAIDLRDQLAKLTDSIRDTHEEVRALSSDTRGFDLFSGAVSSLVHVTQTAVGVQALFGDKNEDVARSIQKLVAIQNIANGVQQLAQDLTKKGTAANKIYAFVQAQLATIMDSTAKASTRLGAALKLATPIGIAIGLFELAKGMGLFGNSAEKAEAQLKRLNDELDRLGTATERSLRDLQFDQDLLIEKLKQRGASEGEINQAVVAGLRGQARAYRELAAAGLESIEKTTGLHVKQVTTLKQAEDALDELKKRRTAGTLTGDGGTLDRALASQLDKAIEVGDKVVGNFQRATAADRAATLAHEQFVTQATDKEIELGRKSATERGKAELELLKFRLGLEADRQAQIAKIDNFDFNSRKVALQTEFTLRKEIINETTAFELDEIDRTQAAAARKHELTRAQEKAFQDQRTLLTEKSTSEIEKLETELSIKLVGLRVEITKRNREELQQEVQDFIDAQDAKLLKAQEVAQRELAERLLRLQTNKTADEKEAIENFNKGLTTKEHLITRLNQIDAEARKDAVELNLISLNDQLRQAREAGVDTLALEQEIADAKAQIQAEATQKTLEADKLEIDLRLQKFESMLNLVRESGAALQSIIGGSFDAQKNQLQDQIDKIEELKNKEIDQINASSDAAEKKAARIKVVEAKAQADKDRLELRQREIDRRKALFDKAFQAMNITIGGIEAVARIKATVAKLTAEAVANPLLLPLIPIAAAQIPITIALTAAQLVALAATPIPKFATGTENAPRGLGIWGDDGQEMMVDRRGRLRLSPPKASLVDLMGGETIFPADVTRNILQVIGTNGPIAGGQLEHTALLDRTEDVVEQLKELNRKSGIHIHNERGIETTAWYDQTFKH